MKPSLYLYVLVFALLTGACGDKQEAATDATPPPQETAAPAEEAAPAPAEPAAEAPATEEAPAEGLRGDAANGATLYSIYCAACHGPGGMGDGPAAAALDPKPANHTDAAFMGTLTDEHLFQVISGGGPAIGKSPLMTPFGGVLTDAQIHDLIAHLRVLSGT